ISTANQTSYLISGNCPSDPGPITVSVGSVQGSSACNAGSFALTLDVSALSDGNLTVSASQTDAVGNTGTANATTNKDLSAPTVIMRSLTASRTNANPILVTVSFSETVSGFTQADVSVGNATLSNFNSSSGMTYSFELTPLANGPVTADIAAGVATDAVGNPNRAAPQLSRIYDPTALSMVFSSDTPDPTSVSPIPVTVTFSQQVSDFTANELTAGNATVRNFSGSGTTYTFELVPISQGLVTADIAAGVASDANGNLNLAPVQFTRMHDNLGPTVSLSTSAAKLTNRSPIPVSVSFSEPVGVFTPTGLTVGNATVGTFSGSGTSYSFELTPLGDGPVTVEIAAGVVTDSVGNPNLAAAALSCTYDGSAPTVMSLRALDVSSANVTNYRFTVVYSDNLAIDQTSLSAGNLRVRGPNGFDQAVTLVDVSAAASGPGVTVTYNLAAPGSFWDRTDNGTYTIVMVADEVRDTAGNAAAAADLGSFRVGLNTLLFMMQSFLPQINLPLAPLRGPDLVVEALTTTNGLLTMTIANLGDTAVSTPFWVDLLIAPERAPVAANDTWDTVGTRGLSWGVTEPLTPGARLTLTLGDRFARPDFSRPGGPIAAGTTLYAHVDAVNMQSSYGGVEESHERLGLPYNNV
ncbi:MAG: Ig-like domain-containing protein, partial [Chloroflexales bacterium]